MSIPSHILSSFAPHGTLRAAINVGNPILASRATGPDGASGVSVDLARAFASRLGCPLELLVVDAAGKSVDAVSEERADIGFFAIDPVRGANIAFTAPYILIEGFYLVPEHSPIRENTDVDKAGLRVVVGKGSAYDLYLTRELKQAEIVRAPTSPAVMQTFLEVGADVAAGVKQQLEADMVNVPNVRLLSERFMVIRQAMGVPKRRGADAANFLHAFLEEMKASGFVAKALERHGIEGAGVAPASAT